MNQETVSLGLPDIEAVKAELQKTYGDITHISITTDEGEKVHGYFKDPSYDLTLYVSDCMMNKEMSKGAEAMVRGCLIPEASDTRIMDKDTHPKIAVSFVLASMRQFKVFKVDPEIKKN